MEKKDLLLDVDEVVCFSGYVEAVNDFLGTNYTVDDFTDYYIDDVAIPEELKEDFKKFTSERNFYEKPKMLPHAVESINLLKEFYNIYICSACVSPFDKKNSGRKFKDKYDFLYETLPFINPDHYIFTGAKHLFRADVQIDDRMSNLDNHIPIRILFPSYHNKGITDEELESKGVIRAGYDWHDGWQEVENILVPKQKIYEKRK